MGGRKDGGCLNCKRNSTKISFRNTMKIHDKTAFPFFNFNIQITWFLNCLGRFPAVVPPLSLSHLIRENACSAYVSNSIKIITFTENITTWSAIWDGVKTGEPRIAKTIRSIFPNAKPCFVHKSISFPVCGLSNAMDHGLLRYFFRRH